MANVKIGSLFVSESKDGRKFISIGLGNKGKDPKYHTTVELTVKDATGKVLAKQVDGFLNLDDPRTQPDDLLRLGIIDEAAAEKMRASVARIPDKIKYTVSVKSKA